MISFLSDINMEDAKNFMSLYRQHCQQLVDIVWKHHFTQVEDLFRHFWQGLSNQYRHLLSCPEMIELVMEKDQITYKVNNFLKNK